MSRPSPRDLYRYWLAMVKREEALSLRIRAAAPGERDRALDLRDPGPGQTYYKLPHAEDVLLRRELVHKAGLTGDRRAFFEHWLRSEMFRQRRRNSGGPEDDGSEYVIGFPVLWSRRRGELMNLLRFPASRVAFMDIKQERWEYGRLAPPVEVGIEAEEPMDGELPYAVDEVVLSRALGVQEELIGDFLGQIEEQLPMSPDVMVAKVTELLTGEPADGSVHALTRAVRARLSERDMWCWPIGVVYDGSAGRTTHHLQRDLSELIRLPESMTDDSPLTDYVSGGAELGWAPHLGARSGRCLTDGQRAVAEQAHGSRLSVAQGPPGTGKTELIIAMAAHATITRFGEAAIRGAEPKRGVLLVCSTNNRAVDNVIEPLCDQFDVDRLPLALRLGSRDVMERVTVPTLERVLKWLETSTKTLGTDDDFRKSLIALAPRLAEVQTSGEADAELTQAVSEIEDGLFEQALMARERWAQKNRMGLGRATKKVLKTLRRTLSVRRLGRSLVFWEDMERLFPVMGCTLLSLGNAWEMDRGVLAQVVIDESGQCHPAYAVSALYRARRALVIGDANQLEPVIGLDRREERRVLKRIKSPLSGDQLADYRPVAGAGVSVQTLAGIAHDKPPPSLVDHFRCQPDIIAISDRLCDYGFDVRTPVRSLQEQSELLDRAVLGVSIAGNQVAALGSWRNDAEVTAVQQLVAKLLQDGVDPAQIAVLTPYRGQLDALERALRGWARGVVSGTVHRFQGGERDVVILSTVVSRKTSLRFTNDRANLVNVAVSRARCHLIIVGDPAVLRQGDVTAELVRAVGDDGWFTMTT